MRKYILLVLLITSFLESKSSNDFEADSLKKIGLNYKRNGDFNLALNYYTASLELYLESESYKGIADCYNKIGVVYFRISERDKALEYYYKSITLNDSINYNPGLLKNYINIGTFYATNHNYKKALHFSKLGLIIATQTGDEYKATMLYNIISNVYSDASSKNTFLNYDSALHYQSQIIKFYIKNNDPYNIAGYYQNIGVIHESNKTLDSALYYYDKSLKIKNTLNYEFEKVPLYLNIGNVYMKSGQRTKAILNYKSGLKLAKKYHNKIKIQSLSKNLKDVYEKEGNFKLANYYFQQYDIYKDSIFNETKSQQIAELQTKYETEKKEQQIVFQKSEIKQRTSQRDTYLIALLIVLILTISLIFIYQQRQKAIALLRKKEKNLHNKKVDDLLKSQEIKSLNAQMEGQEKERKRIAEDLHDSLGSKLAAVKLHYDASLEKIGRNENFLRASAILDETIDETRKIAHNLLSGVLTKFGLQAALKDLKETIHSSNKIDFELNTSNIDDRLPNEMEINIYRIVQELISNILKHAQAKNISVQLTKHDDNSLTLIVEDDGLGFDVKEKNNGIGLQNIYARAEKFDGEVNIDSTLGHGTTTIINLQIPTS